MKPREFFVPARCKCIKESKNGHIAVVTIESYQALERKLEIAKAALEFYSEEENQVGSICGPTGPWDYSKVDLDRGKIAKQALKKIDGGKNG